MILHGENQKEFYENMDHLKLGEKIRQAGKVLIKINLARPAESGHPRTDPSLLADILRYVHANGGTCAIAESANGYLEQDLKLAGLSEVIDDCGAQVLDLDFADTDLVDITGEEHYLPKILKEYCLRIAVPAASKRPGMIFSNNVKLFVGAVPRNRYQLGDEVVDYRPRIHLNLHRSVANLYRSMQWYAPFDFYINGGLAVDERRGEFRFPQILIGSDALELDEYVLKTYFPGLEAPEYLKILAEY